MVKHISKILLWLRRFAKLPDEVAEAKMLLAKMLVRDLHKRGAIENICEAEFKVFSQFGEDGIIQYLIRQIGIPAEYHVFVEFGVEMYEEANTRFLLINDNWRGLIIDGSKANVTHVKQSSIYWRHDLTALAAFVDADNINRLISEAGFREEIGLLSVDIDGNDYWVWERVDVVDPILVVVEYNSVFGSRHAITVPYNPVFVRGTAHHSHLYWGCSLKALELLGQRKGYALVGSNSAGNNAFFVRRDRLNGLKALSAEQAYVESHFRESRDRDGVLTFLSSAARLDEIRELPVHDVENDVVVPISELLP